MYPVWLPVIFIAVPFAGAILIHFSSVKLPWSPDLFTAATAVLLHLSLAACYLAGYTGVIEYSPSAEILRAISSRMPEGVPLESFEVTTLSEEALTGKRIQHLFDSRLVTGQPGVLRLTRRGRQAVRLCLAYRRLLGIKEKAKG